MKNMAKRVRQMLTLLLAVSMLAGSIPMNVFAADTVNSFMETQALSDETGELDLLTVDEETSQTPEEKEETPEEEVLQIPEENAGNEEEPGEEVSQTPEEEEETPGEEASQTPEEKEEIPEEEVSQTPEENEANEESSEEEVPQTPNEDKENEVPPVSGEEESFEEESIPEKGVSVSENDIEESEKVIEEILPQQTVSGNLVEMDTKLTVQEEAEKEIQVTFQVNEVDGEPGRSYVNIYKIIEDEDGDITGTEVLEPDADTLTATAGKEFKFILETDSEHKISMVKLGGMLISAETKEDYTYYKITPAVISSKRTAILMLFPFSISFSKWL